jgi:flagellar biosynthesis protein
MKKKEATRAVALRYDRAKEGAPRVVAKGQGHVADNIVAAARQHGVPLHEDPNLAATLNALDLETEIPPELYRAVAEVLVFIYRLNGKLNGP